MKKIKSSNSKYPRALKRQIAREYLSGKFSYAVGAQEYGLKDKDVVKEFVRWYKKSANIVDMESITGLYWSMSTYSRKEGREQYL